jgi:hypothetical protein
MFGNEYKKIVPIAPMYSQITKFSLGALHVQYIHRHGCAGVALRKQPNTGAATVRS